MGDKTQGGGEVKTLVKKALEQNQTIGATVELKKTTESSMLISQQPCGKVGMARVRRLMLAQGQQVRQTKSNKENRYVIKVMRLNTEGGAVPLVRENQRMHRAF